MEETSIGFLAPVVQTLDSAIQWINHYPLDNSIGFASVYPLDSDLSDGQRYPSFEQLGPGGSPPRDTKLNRFSRKWKSSHVRFYNFLLKHEYLKRFRITQTKHNQ